MKITNISDEQIYALEQAIRSTVQERIDTVTDECSCLDCQKGKKHYVQIIDKDRYVNVLNDWD